jgi:hypothetical protein
MTRGESIAASSFMERLTKKQTAWMDAGTEYIEHCRLNDADPACPLSLCMYVVSLSRYKSSTQADRVKSVRKYLRRSGFTEKVYKGVTMHDVLSDVNVQAAKERVKKAPYVELSNLIKFIIEQEPSRVRCRAAFLLCTGLRNADASYGPATTWGSKELAVVVSVSKNRRQQRHRATLRLPYEHSILAALGEQIRSLARKDDLQPLSTYALNKWLRPLCATSYSIRRCYVNYAIEEHRKNDGTVMWESVKQRTLHFSSDTIQAYYESCEELLSTRCQRRVHFLDE